MSVVRLAKDDSTEPPGDEEDLVEEKGVQGRAIEAEGGATGGAAEVSGELDLRSLYNLLQTAIKTQERESYKHEQRWHSVQVQLNNVWDELDTERQGRQRPVVEAAVPALPVEPPVQPPEARRSPAASPPVPQHPTVPPENLLNPRVPSAVPYPVPVPAASLYPAMDPAAPSPVAWTRAAVPKLEEGDDIEQYLTTFERLAVTYRLPRTNWAVYLMPYLIGQARAVYVAMDSFDAMDYDKVKEATLTKFEINEKVYRQRFRDPEVRTGETPRELYNRLRDLYRKWIKPSRKSVEEVGEILILEQYLRTLAPEVHVWVKEHRPATGQQAAELVEAFLAARWGPKTFRVQTYSRPAIGVSLGDPVVELALGGPYRVGRQTHRPTILLLHHSIGPCSLPQHPQPHRTGLVVSVTTAANLVT